MLDRAVSFSVKFFVPLALIWLAFGVPLAVLQYFGTADFTQFFGHLIDAIQRSGTNPDPQVLARAMQLAPVFNAFTVWYLVLATLVAPLANAALIGALSAAYLEGATPAFSVAYRDAIRVWLQMIGLALVWIAFLLLAYVAIVLAGIVIALLLFGLSALSRYVGIATGTLIVLAGGIAFAAALAVGIVAAGVSFYAVVVERSGFITAFSSALSRTVGRALGRSCLAGLAYLAVLLGFSLVNLLLQALAIGVLRSHPVAAVLQVLNGVIVAIFSAAFFGAYYFDVRVRTEGFDIGLAARESAAVAPLPE